MPVTALVRMELLRCDKKQNGAKRPFNAVLSRRLFLKMGVLVQKLGQNTGSDLLRYLCLFLLLRLNRMLLGLVISVVFV